MILQPVSQLIHRSRFHHGKFMLKHNNSHTRAHKTTRTHTHTHTRRDAVTCLAFREGSHQLFSGSLDRTVKLWSLDDKAYMDTLFGHQAEASWVVSLCLTLGEKDTFLIP